MTWSQFLTAMKSGVQARAAAIRRGAARQQPQRNMDNTPQRTLGTTEHPTIEGGMKQSQRYENIALDVSEESGVKDVNCLMSSRFQLTSRLGLLNLLTPAGIW